ncbi:hypothetical protein JTE90_012676 [Oedothorax gibbosus]|uniref:Uncharacterized protein n=1 Tax=Oedothorax gibbosus TaxID=931172 RepID=A0AAV6W0V8_9ARAC|nr:hypothetical protein JTE90_012676 [Oedothorax gibbosus]
MPPHTCSSAHHSLTDKPVYHEQKTPFFTTQQAGAKKNQCNFSSSSPNRTAASGIRSVTEISDQSPDLTVRSLRQSEPKAGAPNKAINFVLWHSSQLRHLGRGRKEGGEVRALLIHHCQTPVIDRLEHPFSPWG